MSTSYRSTLRLTFWQRYALSIILALTCWTGLESKASALDNPIPLISQPLNPDSVVPGGPGFTLTVNGTGFVSGSLVSWNGSPRATTFVSQSQLIASITTSDVSTPQTGVVTVTSPSPEGGTSNPAYFSVALPKRSMSFTSSNGLKRGAGPVAVADFNGDGRLDLVIGNLAQTNQNSFLLLLGKGDGTFQAPVTVVLPNPPSSVVAADFNHDGNTDLAMSEQNQTGQIEVALGDGHGTFQSARSYPAGVGAGSSIVAADFNGDGELDLAVTNQGGASVSILLGKSDGSFQLPISVNGIDRPASTAIGDFNSDGKLDLAVANDGDGTVTILLGNGDGTFNLGGTLITDKFPTSIAAADFNRDGKLDLVVDDYLSPVNPGFQIFLGNGDGSFQNGFTFSSTTPFLSVIAADINADGVLDIVGGAGGSEYTAARSAFSSAKGRYLSKSHLRQLESSANLAGCCRSQ
jgi:hypothetical protein